MLKQRRWAYEPRFLWASAVHRRLGAAAALAAVAAAASGAAFTTFGRNAYGQPFLEAAAALHLNTPGPRPMLLLPVATAALKPLALGGGLLYLFSTQTRAAFTELRLANTRKKSSE